MSVNDGENQPDNVNHSEDRHREYDTDKHTKAENDEACANIWALYVDEAERYDKRLVESWMSDMDSMLIFVSPFIDPLERSLPRFSPVSILPALRRFLSRAIRICSLTLQMWRSRSSHKSLSS